MVNEPLEVALKVTIVFEKLAFPIWLAAHWLLRYTVWYAQHRMLT